MTTSEGSASTMIVSSIAREPRENLPSLIDDARQNPIVKVEAPEGDVLVKNVAYPYVEKHILVIPDRSDGVDMPGVVDVPGNLLHSAFLVAADVASYYESDPEVQALDIGFNYSPQENKKIIASQRKNLHIHVEGFTQKDLDHRITDAEVRRRPEFKRNLSEPAQPIINDLMQRVFREVALINPEFDRLFERVSDKGRITFRLKAGLDTLRDTGFSSVMKDIHDQAKLEYDEIARCFLEINPETSEYFESEDGRYKLLKTEERVERVREYIEQNEEDLSAASRGGLIRFAELIQPIVNLSKGNQDFDFQRFAAIKDFAYAAVVSGVKKGEEWDYRFGFDPVVLSKRDSNQASRGEFKLFERDGSKNYDHDTLIRVKEDEEALGKYLIKKPASGLPYVAGPSFEI